MKCSRVESHHAYNISELQHAYWQAGNEDSKLFVSACRFTGADVSALVREAAFMALEADMEAATVSQVDFLKALHIMKPSVPVTPAQAHMYAAFRQGSH